MQRFWAAVLVFVASVSLHGAEPPAPAADAALGGLKSSDPEVRVEALRKLQTSLDPRIPDAMLPLLADEGNSIRRLAARAVGSRWWQIAETDRAAFQGALTRNASSDLEDERNMVRRALGLLTRSYEGNMFARSADKRWVVYERYGLPCLIDTKSGTEELLGWTENDPAALVSSWGNGATADAILWHPRKPLAAFAMLLSRRSSTAWVWKHGAALRKITPEEMLAVLEVPQNAAQPAGGFFVDAMAWKGDELRFEFSYSTAASSSADPVDHTAVLGWDSARDTLRVVEREKK